MQNQDYNVVVFHNTKNLPNEKVKKEKNFSAEISQKNRNIESDDYTIPKVDLQIKQKIINARCSKGWSQKQLAEKTNLKLNIINSYEKGDVVADRQILNKIGRALGTNL